LRHAFSLDDDNVNRTQSVRYGRRDDLSFVTDQAPGSIHSLIDADPPCPLVMYVIAAHMINGSSRI